MSLHDVSFYLAQDELVLGESLGCAVLRMAVKLTTGSPPPWYTLVSSTNHFIVQRCRSLKALEVNIALKSLLSMAPDPIWQLSFPGVAAFQEPGLCV